MNIGTLNAEQRKAIAVLAFQMMVADHSAASAEHARVNWLERELGVLGTIAPNEYFAEPATDLFPDRPTRLLVMAELFLVALADGHRHPNENEMLRRLCQAFELSETTVADLLAWAATPADRRAELRACVL